MASHTNVGHVDHVAYDEARSRILRSAGLTVLRFRNNEVYSGLDRVLEVIRRELATRVQTPSPPHPHLEGEG